MADQGQIYHYLGCTRLPDQLDDEKWEGGNTNAELDHTFYPGVYHSLAQPFIHLLTI